MSLREASGERPTIALFLYDDLESGALSVFGGGAPTPTFDFLAHGGVAYRSCRPQGYESWVACAALLTGRWPHRSGVHPFLDRNDERPAAKGYARPGVVDLARAAYDRDYTVKVFNLPDLNACLPKVAWHNRGVTAPHVGQIEELCQRKRGRPLLLVDRFRGASALHKSDANRWALRAALMGDPDAAHHLRTAALKCAGEEDRRLGSVLSSLARTVEPRNLVVAVAGIPGDAARVRAALRPDDACGDYPLLLWRGDGSFSGRHPVGFARQVDIAPTLAAVAALEGFADADGVDLLGRTPPQESILLTDTGVRGEPESKAEAVGAALGRAVVVDPVRQTGPVIQKRALFIMAHPRSGTMFFTKLFQGSEFINTYCPRHNWPDLYEVNELYGAGAIRREAARAAVVAAGREAFGRAEELVVSVSHNSYHLVELLAEVFINSLFVFVTRDPRAVIVSEASWPWNTQQIQGQTCRHETEVGRLNGLRGEGGTRAGWIDVAARRWAAITGGSLAAMDRLGGRGLVVRFEEVFDAGANYPGMKTIARFVEGLVRTPTEDAWLAERLGKKINSFSYTFPRWEQWTNEERQTLLGHCGPLMERLGYTPAA